MGALIDKISEYIGGKDQSANKLFTASNFDTKHVSKVRVNREYLISQNIAQELNVYRSFTPFHTFNDVYNTVMSKESGEWKEVDLEKKKIGAWGTRSLFNKSGAVLLGYTGGQPDIKNILQASEWRISNNVPLLDTQKNRRAIKESSQCTVKDLVIGSQSGELGRETYDYSDFMYCKYLGKMSNNYLITLRRFPFPVDDYISTVGVGKTRKLKDIQSQNAQSIGCMVTWMGTPGNEMSNILKYTVSMPFKSQRADWQDGGASADSQTGLLNGIAAVFDPVYRKQYELGQASSAGNAFLDKFFNVGSAPYNAADINNWRDHNKVYGPVDAIKETYMRSEEGIKFDQTMTLVFDYELRSYNGINGRQAMLDLISNILNVTYTTGTFWGGGYKSAGAHQNNIFANLQVFKTSGGFTNFIDALTNDAKTLGGMFDANIQKQGGYGKSILNALNNLGGMLVGGILNKLGRPARQMVYSLLSPAPVGFWHVTIGNPYHPIMSLGNMILKSTTIEHYGPLGLDDFPTGLKVTCELERGKPRDIRGIEQIYMHGNDRIYTSMGPKVFKMYEESEEYKGKRNVQFRGEVNTEVTTNSELDKAGIDSSTLKSMGKVLQKYFGQTDAYSIYVAAMEQEYGASGKNKKGTAGGDSRQKGTGKK